MSKASEGKRKRLADEPEMNPEEDGCSAGILERKDRWVCSPRKFQDPPPVSKHLLCSICTEMFEDPQRAPCGHSFCKKCIVTWLQENKTCPEDKQPLNIDELHHDFILESIVRDQKDIDCKYRLRNLIANCTYRIRGCKKELPISFMRAHERRCEFNPAKQFPYRGAGLFSRMADKAKDQKKQIPPSSTVTSGAQETPEQPSLMMRQFTTGTGARDMLNGIFEKKDNDE